MLINWGRQYELHFNENGAMFTLEHDNEVEEFMCARRLTSSEPNRCWLFREFLSAMVEANVVTPVLKGPNLIIEEVEDDDYTEAVLCDIIHPDFHDGGYTSFGDVARRELNQQCQYASRYIEGKIEGYPALGEGLRFKDLDRGNYHFIRIHRDDVEEFVNRYRRYHQAMIGSDIG